MESNNPYGTGQAKPNCASEASAMFNSMWSPATREHFRSARIEFLKGVRSLIDHRIERLSKTGTQQRGTTVPVD